MRESKKRRKGIVIMRQLTGLVKPLIPVMCAAVFLGVLGYLCAIFLTVIAGYELLGRIFEGDFYSVGNVAVILLILAVLRGIFHYGEQYCNHFIAFKLLAVIRHKVFAALRKLCPAKLEGRERGNLISIITSDIELLEVFYAHTISPIFIALLFSIIMVSFIGSYHAVLGMVALAAYIVVGGIIPLLTSRLSGDVGVRFRTKSGLLSGFVLDSLRGLAETIQYGQGEKRMEDINRQTDCLSEDEKRMKQTAGRNTAVTNTVILIFDLGMLFLSASLVGFEGCLIVTLALMSSFGPVIALASLGATLQNTFAAGNRVLDILEESPVVEEVDGKEKVDFHGAAAENVTFAYGEELILDHFSVKIPESKIIGINGRSGSGKSTLLKLFMRFWQVQKGRVEISGRNVDQINTWNLREMESFVTQETHLFHDSIRNNLRIAKLDATDKEIEDACKKASVHEFIMSLPKGYNTEVGELGDTLSGGERQRLGLARAFLHDAPFMLLDEPTSNLDSLNEAVILKSLHEECADKSVVLVSHRKSTMGIADTVYSVENGRMS